MVTVKAENLTVYRTSDWGACRGGIAGLCAGGIVEGAAYAIHGQVSIRHRPNGTYGIFIQDYDFEMHFEASFKMIPRNIATLLGSPGGGWPNTKFEIKYDGNTNITNP